MHPFLTRRLLLALALLLVSCGAEAPPRLPEANPAPAGERMRPSGVTVVPAPAPAGAETQSNADPRSLGDPNAPITVIEYADFQCPYCAAFARQTKPRIIAEYVETGKVYFVYRDLPIAEIHPGAILASHVANCAAEQGGFWQMHGRLFQGFEAGEWQRGGLEGLQIFLGYARELGLDDAALRSCVESNRYASSIEADVRAAAERGIQSTPVFLINGQPLIGAQPFETFQRAFDQILAGQ
jgi:protein-disulfide isomerase